MWVCPVGAPKGTLLNQGIWDWRGPVSCYLHEVQRDRKHDPLLTTNSEVEMMASHNGARGHPEFPVSQKGCRWPSENTQGPWVRNLGEASPWGPGTSPRKHTRSMQPTSRTTDVLGGCCGIPEDCWCWGTVSLMETGLGASEAESHQGTEANQDWGVGAQPLPPAQPTAPTWPVWVMAPDWLDSPVPTGTKTREKEKEGEGSIDCD